MRGKCKKMFTKATIATITNKATKNIFKIKTLLIQFMPMLYGSFKYNVQKNRNSDQYLILKKMNCPKIKINSNLLV